MAKLRKMLGSVDSPHITALMRMIETQSKQTLALWAVNYTQNNYLDIYEKAYSNDKRLNELCKAVHSHLEGSLKLAELKALLKQARLLAAEAEADPTAQAAARAVSTACGVITTPTNALGFAFYGAAAFAYSRAGLSASAEEYDALADEELSKIALSLKSCLVENEPNPVKVNWNC